MAAKMAARWDEMTVGLKADWMVALKAVKMVGMMVEQTEASKVVVRAVLKVDSLA